MFKNPVTNLVLGIVVVLWALYSLFGPHEEAQSQGVIILQVVLLICATAGAVGSAILIAKRNQQAGGGGRAR
jgi:O-antigen/teichoic acid export membrane protein